MCRRASGVAVHVVLAWMYLSDGVMKRGRSARSLRTSLIEWQLVTCGAIAQDLGHEGVENVLAFSTLVGTDWKLWCKPQSKADEWEFDGVAAFLQQHLG
jgi:hypothetical protein